MNFARFSVKNEFCSLKRTKMNVARLSVQKMNLARLRFLSLSKHNPIIGVFHLICVALESVLCQLARKGYFSMILEKCKF